MKLRLLLLVALGPAAAAQSFNIDVGMNLGFFAPTPDPTYGAASGQSGHWDAFLPTLTATALEALDAATTTVTLRSDATSTFNVFPGVMTPGDDQRLMEDFHITPNLNMPSTWTFEGLANGDYTVYTYASDPTSAGVRTEITVAGSVDPPQQVGAGWPGAHAPGQTYSQHDVTVTSGTLVVVGLVVGGQLDSGVINGFQVVLNAGSTIGTSYCTANPNVSGLPAVMSGAGSGVVAQNNLTLTCSQMTPNAFGFFLTSPIQGFVPNPAGSLGNLCLGGAIGRYVGPGQIQNSGPQATISLTLDLTRHPTPTGFVSVQPGETWNFQAWFRDIAAIPASNFSDGYEVVFQ